MVLNNQTKILIGVGIVLLLFFLYYIYANSLNNNNNNENENENFGSLPRNIEKDDKIEGFNGQNDDDDDFDETCDQTMDKENLEYSKKDYLNNDKWIEKKLNSKNKAQKGYKKSSYNSGNRFNNGPNDWEKYFDNNNNILVDSNNANDNFLPMDETCGGYANFKSTGKEKCGSNQDCTPEDLFNIKKYLPKQKREDWFDVPDEPISVKNRHLINVSKPIGINTQGTSLRNASYDLRATPPAPKFQTGPWNQSTVDVDNNIKSFE